MKFYFIKNHFKIILFFLCSLLSSIRTFAQLPSLITSREKNTKHVSAEDVFKKNMFVKVIVSKQKVFVGEPVMALYKFYTSVHGQAVVAKQPEFTGCSVTELNFDQNSQDEIINGETYSTYIIRKVQLMPVQAGKLSLGVASVINHVEVPDPNNSLTYNRYDITSSNAETNIVVEDLPENNKPKNFYGITGNFTITAKANNKIAVGENDHLIITINGAGNLDAIDKPDIHWPAGIEHFDGNDSQHVDQSNFPVSGDRIFDIPFVGKKEGTVKIEPIVLSFFNPDIKNYQTISTDSISITFTKALDKADEYKDVVYYDISNRKYIWIVGAIALVVIVISLLSYRSNKKQLIKNNIIESTATPAPVFEPVVKFKYKTDFSRYWGEWQNISESKLFFTKGKELLMTAISEFADSNHNTEVFLLAEMKNKLNDEKLCSKVFELIETCNEKMYAPFDTETELNFYFTEIKSAIEKLRALS